MALFQDEAVARRSEEQARAEPVHLIYDSSVPHHLSTTPASNGNIRAPGNYRNLRGRRVVLDDRGLLAVSLTKNMQKLKEFSQLYCHEPARGMKWVKPRSPVLI